MARRAPMAKPALTAKPAPMAKPSLSLSLQFADPTHRAYLPRHKVSELQGQ